MKMEPTGHSVFTTNPEAQRLDPRLTSSRPVKAIR